MVGTPRNADSDKLDIAAKSSNRKYTSSGASFCSASEPVVSLCGFDLWFVDSSTFSTFIGVVLLFNLVVIWAETDYPGLKLWVALDNVFLAILIVELGLRVAFTSIGGIKHYSFRRVSEICFCFIIVSLGVLDLWVVPLFGSINAAKLLRCTRVLRCLRLFRLIPQLEEVVLALLDIFGKFFWAFVVLFMFLFICAVCLTRLLGHAEALGEREGLENVRQEVLRKVGVQFGDMPHSLFTLFQLTTLDNWDGIAYPLVEFNSWWRGFFVIFIVFGPWSMISILTAIASTQMIKATANEKEERVREQEQKDQDFIDFLRDAFTAADADGNGVLDFEEFEQMIGQDFVHRQMNELGVHMSHKEFLRTWAMLDIDDSGTLTIDEFVAGLSTLQEGLAAKHMVSINYSLKKVAVKSVKRMDIVLRNTVTAAKERANLCVQFAPLANDTCVNDERLWREWQARSNVFAGKLPQLDFQEAAVSKSNVDWDAEQTWA